MKKRILIVEDEQPILQFIRRGLTHKGFETLTAVNGEEALRVVHDTSPDLVVLDVMLPDFDGIEVCRYLRSSGNETLPILMLTARDELTDKIAGLNSGADDYITKPFDFEELVARIRAVLRRIESTQPLSQTIEIGDLIIDETTHQVTRAGKPIELTRREYDLLELLAKNGGQVLSKERIFERVWGYDNEAGLEVIKVYINYIRSKLNSDDQPDLIHAIRGVGYMLKP